MFRTVWSLVVWVLDRRRDHQEGGQWTDLTTHSTLLPPHRPCHSPSLPTDGQCFYTESSTLLVVKREFQFFIVIFEEEGVRIQIKFNLLWPWHVQLRLRICYFIFLGTLYSNLTLSMSLEFTWLCRSWNQESYWLWMIIATFIIQIRTTSLGLPGQ